MFASLGIPHILFMVAFGALCASWVAGLIQARNARRVIVGQAGAKAQSLGMTETAKLCSAYSEGRYGDFLHELKSLLHKFTSDPNFVVTEAKTLAAHLASTVDGLKVLTDAVAAAPKAA